MVDGNCNLCGRAANIEKAGKRPEGAERIPLFAVHDCDIVPLIHIPPAVWHGGFYKQSRWSEEKTTQKNGRDRRSENCSLTFYKMAGASVIFV